VDRDEVGDQTRPPVAPKRAAEVETRSRREGFAVTRAAHPVEYLSPDRHTRLVTCYPCRYDCPAASSYATAVFNAAPKVDATAAGGLRAALLGEMHIGADGTRGLAASPFAETLTVHFATF
jgi:hypothetical protein